MTVDDPQEPRPDARHLRGGVARGVPVGGIDAYVEGREFARDGVVELSGERDERGRVRGDRGRWRLDGRELRRASGARRGGHPATGTELLDERAHGVPAV